MRVSVGERSPVLANPSQSPRTDFTVALPLLLAWAPSPPYEPVTVLEPSREGV